MSLDAERLAVNPPSTGRSATFVRKKAKAAALGTGDAHARLPGSANAAHLSAEMSFGTNT
jgi:hypothetical protein